MKYYVIARHWDGEKQSNYIAGEFSDFANANLFCKAYNEKYKAGALVVTQDDLVNR